MMRKDGRQSADDEANDGEGMGLVYWQAWFLPLLRNLGEHSAEVTPDAVASVSPVNEPWRLQSRLPGRQPHSSGLRQHKTGRGDQNYYQSPST